MNQCIYTKEEFEEAKGEHVLQNFLGARWTSKTIVANNPQDYFGKTIDSDLEKGLKVIRNLIGSKGGRGGSGPDLKHICSTGGNKYHLKPGGIPEIAEPIITERKGNSSNPSVNVKISSIKQLEWAINQIEKQYGGTNCDIEKIKETAISVCEPINETLHLQAQIGGENFFRGLLKSIFNLLCVNNTEIALNPIFDSVREFILTGNGNIERFIRWQKNDNFVDLPKLSEFDHFICVYDFRGNIEGFVQFFGDLSFPLRLATNCTHKFRYSYLVNPLRDTKPAEIRNPDFTIENLPQFDEGVSKPGKQIWPIYSGKISRIVDRYMKKTDSDNLSKIVEEILLPHDGETMTKEIMNELTTKITKYIISRINFGKQ